MAWAVENGITTGTSETTFSPNAACTRAQSVTFLFRALGKLTESGETFRDVPKGSYYEDAGAGRPNARQACAPRRARMCISGRKNIHFRQVFPQNGAKVLH